MKRRILVALAGLVLLAGSASATPVGLELMLLVDVSGSVDNTEYTLQRDGYVAAFQNGAIQAQIATITGGVAVAYAEWSGQAEQAVAVGWTVLTDAASANAFAAAILASPRLYAGQTAPGSAINFGVNQLNTNTYEGARRVIDVSGDGEQNQGADTSDARDAAHALAIRINGLAIGNATLQAWYANNVVTPGGSLYVANDFGDFRDAISAKIGREIVPEPIPEPGTMLLLGSGIAGLAMRRRGRKAA